jgi:hypothetical protein
MDISTAAALSFVEYISEIVSCRWKLDLFWLCLLINCILWIISEVQKPIFDAYACMTDLRDVPTDFTLEGRYVTKKIVVLHARNLCNF